MAPEVTAALAPGGRRAAAASPGASGAGGDAEEDEDEPGPLFVEFGAADDKAKKAAKAAKISGKASPRTIVRTRTTAAPVCHGYLQKRMVRKSLLGSGWQRRYVALEANR
jgi:hypothetical protein